MNGETITVPVFVQPDSKQECLLGTNASIPLGFKFTNGKGKLLRTGLEPDPNPSVAQVSLIKATTILSRKSCLLKIRVTGEHCTGKQFIFESENAQLQPLGACTSDSLVTMCDGGTVFIPVHNFSNHSIRLPNDTEFGTLEPFSKSLISDPVHDATCAKVLVDGPGCHEKDNNDRFAKLLSMLDLSVTVVQSSLVISKCFCLSIQMFLNLIALSLVTLLLCSMQ